MTMQEIEQRARQMVQDAGLVPPPNIEIREGYLQMGRFFLEEVDPTDPGEQGRAHWEKWEITAAVENDYAPVKTLATVDAALLEMLKLVLADRIARADEQRGVEALRQEELRHEQDIEDWIAKGF